MVNYPLTYTFKKLALTNKVNVKDAQGNNLMHAHQKMFKLKENILIFTDDSKTQQLGQINADKVIDFSPTYAFVGANGVPLSSVKRQGKRSIWRAHYEIHDGNGQHWFTIREDNAWAKVLDALFREIPLAGIFAGYLFNPRYNVLAANGSVVGSIAKQKALLESEYRLDCPSAASVDPGNILPSGVLIVIIRERFRG